WLAWTLALMGRLDEAAARDREGLEHARQLGDAFSLAWGCHAGAVTRQMFGDWRTSEGLAAEAVTLAAEHGFPYVLGMATVDQGWALIMQGNAAGIPLLRRGVAAIDATGARLVRPAYLGMLALADKIEGRPDAAAARLDDALREVERTGERVHEPDLLIGRSNLLAADASSRPAMRAAEEGLRRACDVARALGACLLGLRAALALARLYQQCGRDAEGHAAVAAAHAPFADLRPRVPEIAAARRLLAELGG